jgi:hypothetical protein
MNFGQKGKEILIIDNGVKMEASAKFGPDVIKGTRYVSWTENKKSAAEPETSDVPWVGSARV